MLLTFSRYLGQILARGFGGGNSMIAYRCWGSFDVDRFLHMLVV